MGDAFAGAGAEAGDVRAHAERSGAQTAGRGREAGGVTARDHHLRALLDEAPGDRESHAAVAAGDQRHLAFEAARPGHVPAFSYVWANCSTARSPSGRPISCIPIGSPVAPKPTGTLMHGRPASVA